jgi:hypothetical protein
MVQERFQERGFSMFHQDNYTDYCAEQFGKDCHADEYNIEFRSSKIQSAGNILFCGVIGEVRGTCDCGDVLPIKEVGTEKAVSMTLSTDDCVRESKEQNCNLTGLRLRKVDNDPQTYVPVLSEAEAKDQCYVDVSITGTCICPA